MTTEYRSDTPATVTFPEVLEPHPENSFAALFSHSLQARIAGNLDEAERLAEAAVETGEPDALTLYTGQLFSIRLDQGRLDEFVELMEAGVEDNPGIPSFAV